MKKTLLIIITILLVVTIIGCCIYIINNKDKIIKLTDEEKIEINNQLLLFIGINSRDYTFDLSKDGGSIIETDVAKYNLMGFLGIGINQEDTILIEDNEDVTHNYIEISKFQSYAKKVYNQELNLNNLKDYISIQDNISYIKVPLEGMSADYAIKADYIVKNKKEGTRSLYIDIIDICNDNINSDEVDKYLSADFLEYDKSKVTYTLKITYALNSETQQNYIVSVESV